MYLFFILLSLGLNLQAEVIEKISAIVNNEIITETDISNFNKKISNNEMIDDQLLFDKSINDIKGNRKALLDFLINEKIITSEVKKLNLSITQDRVDEELRLIAKRNNVSKNELVDALKKQGINFAEYKDFIKSKIERDSLFNIEIYSKIKISDEDISSEYSKRNKSESNSIYEYSVAHILFSLKKSGEEAAQQKATAVLEKLRRGESFETLAEQHSEDTNFATGGFLGNFKAGEISKDLEKAVESLKPGEYSGLVKSKQGIHILKLLSRKVVSDPRYEKEKEKIKALLYESAGKKQLALWLEQKRDESFIRINN